MRTVTSADGYEFTQQHDGTWLGGMGDIYDYPPDHQYFCHSETGEVVLLPPGELVESDRLFGISTTPTFIFQGAQLTYDQLASRVTRKPDIMDVGAMPKNKAEPSHPNFSSRNEESLINGSALFLEQHSVPFLRDLSLVSKYLGYRACPLCPGFM